MSAGRYAPSPSGALHMGSLLAALGSYLQARGQGARWLLRIDDLDTPRVVAGADRRILDALTVFGFRWDGDVLYQSARRAAYACALDALLATGRAFECGCTRREAQAGVKGIEGPIYPGTCRDGLPPGRLSRSLRLRVDESPLCFVDAIQGRHCQILSRDIGDFVIRRADGIAAYQLATVLDDAHQGVSEVVRGADLLSSTPRQMALQRNLGLPVLSYGHLPVLVDADGQKLGKSRGALGLSADAIADQLWCCLDLLGQNPPDTIRDAAVPRVMRWAIDNWNIELVPRVQTLDAQVYQRSSSQRSGFAQ
ncbi:tRNA glutamyl-Q(34) synthetase GluQRS [Salinisphaera aquimarina]